MGKYRIEYLPAAIKDLHAIFDYISGELSAPQAAIRLLDKIDQSVSRLSTFPYSCEKAKDVFLSKKGYRLLVVDNYIVFYIVINDTVRIRRVLYKKSSYEQILF